LPRGKGDQESHAPDARGMVAGALGFPGARSCGLFKHADFEEYCFAKGDEAAEATRDFHDEQLCACTNLYRNLSRLCDRGDTERQGGK
jgi:hypothetical protein